MIKVTNYIRVRYAETDQMGFVYYGNYAQYLEVSRVELFRHLGISYKEIEERGVLLPVSHFSIDYKLAATYDDEIKIITKIKELPRGVKIHFEYELFNKNQQLIATAQTTLFFLKQCTKKVIKCPDFIFDKLLPNF